MLKELFEIIEDRKINPTDASYTTSLLASGEDRILQKIGEEAIELILAVCVPVVIFKSKKSKK